MQGVRYRAVLSFRVAGACALFISAAYIPEGMAQNARVQKVTSQLVNVNTGSNERLGEIAPAAGSEQAQGEWVDPDRPWLPFRYNEDEGARPPEQQQPSEEPMPMQEQPADQQIQVQPLEPLPYDPSQPGQPVQEPTPGQPLPGEVVPQPQAPAPVDGQVPAQSAAPGEIPAEAPQQPGSQVPGYQGFAPTPTLDPSQQPVAAPPVDVQPTEQVPGSAPEGGELDTMLKDMFGGKQPSPNAVMKEHPYALVRILDKNTARVEQVAIPVEESQVEALRYGPFSLVAYKCVQADRYEGVRHLGLLDIQEHFKSTGQSKEEELVTRFHGWMVSDAAELNPLEHPVFDVTLVACVDKNPQHKEEPKEEKEPEKKAEEKSEKDAEKKEVIKEPAAETEPNEEMPPTAPAEEKLKEVHDKLPASMQKKQVPAGAPSQVPASQQPHNYAPSTQVPASQRNRAGGAH